MNTIEHVLMDKRTGELMLGYRVSLLDKLISNASTQGWVVMCTDARNLDYDGWLVQRPDVSQFAWFMNRSCEKWMEVLGTLE